MDKDISTKFANSKRRTIFTTPGGRSYIRTTEGTKQYNPKAKYTIGKGGKMTVIKKDDTKVAPSIRAKATSAAGKGDTNISTGFANSMRRTIFTTPAGKAYTRTTSGTKQYKPKAKYAIGRSRKMRTIKKNDVKKVAPSIRGSAATLTSAPVTAVMSVTKAVQKQARKLPVRKPVNVMKNTAAAAAKLRKLIKKKLPFKF